MLITLIALVIILFYLLARAIKMAPFYLLSSKIPGPYAFPVIGCAWKFINKNPEEVMETIIDISKGHSSPLRLWLGPKFILVIQDPENTRIVLSTSRMSWKGDFYKFMEPVLGRGLITGSGERWREHKRLIYPLLHNNFVSGLLSMFQSFSKDFLDDLEKFAERGPFNVEHIIQKYVIDVIAIKVLGYDTETRKGQNLQILEAPKSFYDLIAHRICRPWLQPTQLFKFSKFSKIQQQVIEDMDNFILKAIQNSRKRIQVQEVSNDSPTIDKLISAINENPGIMTDAELGYHLKTLFVASEDTVVNISSFILLCLGMYPNHQERILQETDKSLLLTKHLTDKHLSNFPHLTKCMKEVLRLFPVGPFIIRKTVDHFQLGDLILPPTCSVMISIWAIHHDPNQWEHPDDFYPEHFEADAVSKRHPCSYIPFSMGSRACVGKQVAYPWLKLIVATVLKRFQLHADGSLKTLKIKADVTIRAKDGYNISLKRRMSVKD